MNSEWVSVIILGIIEGVTEFLPVSSTGHLLLAEKYLTAQPEVFNIVIQCGTVGALFGALSNRIKNIWTTRNSPATVDYVLKLSVSFLITGVFGVVLKKMGLKLPQTLAPVAWATFIGGVVFLWVDKAMVGRVLAPKPSWLAAVLAGFAQLVAAAFPGTSRSGATILAVWCSGTDRREAVEFSFLLGIPTLIGAGVFELWHVYKHPTLEAVRYDFILVGALVSGITAFLSVKWLLRYLTNHSLAIFGWYRILLGGSILVASLF